MRGPMGRSASDPSVSAAIASPVANSAAVPRAARRAARESDLSQDLPGEAVLGKDDEPDAPLLAPREDGPDLEQQLVVMDTGDALTKPPEEGLQLLWGVAFRAQRIRPGHVEEGILEGRTAGERDGRLAGQLGDGDASVGARRHRQSGTGEQSYTGLYQSSKVT
jgi:hypothetical protein